MKILYSCGKLCNVESKNVLQNGCAQLNGKTFFPKLATQKGLRRQCLENSRLKGHMKEITKMTLLCISYILFPTLNFESPC